MRSWPLIVAAALAAAPAALRAQPAVTGSVSLVGVGNGLSANPFGLAFSRDGYLWVAVAGNSCSPSPCTGNNNVVVRIDPTAMAITSPGEVTVGLFPEEIAFTNSASGAPRYGWVSVSTDGTIVAFGADPSQSDFLSVVATIPHPSGPYAPFGLAAKPDQSRVYAGDFIGAGPVLAIDAVAGSATQFQILSSESLPVPGAHARMAFSGNTLIVPSTDFSAYPSSCALVSGVDPANPASLWTRCVACGTPPLYVSAQDVAVEWGGTVFVNGYDLGARVYLFAGPTGTLVRSVHTGLGAAQQGIGVSENGTLVAVTDFVSNSVLFLDGRTHQRLATVPLGPFAGPNDVVFTDGTAFVTAQFSAAVVRIENLPTGVPSPYALTLAATATTPPLGGTTTLTLSGASVGAILVSGFDAPGPMGGGLALEIDPAFLFILAGGPGPVLAISVAVPPDPILECASVFLQGVGVAGGQAAVSNPIVVIPQ